MAEKESKLINTIFSALATNGKLSLYELFASNPAIRNLSGGRHELNAFLWNHTHFFHFYDTQQKYGNQDRERYTPFAHLLVIHLRQCNDCTIGCLQNFLAETENDIQFDIATQWKYYCGYDAEGLLQFLHNHEGLFMINNDTPLIQDKAIQLHHTAFNYDSVKFSEDFPIYTLSNSSSLIRDNSCVVSGTAIVVATYQSQSSVTMEFITSHLAGDYIYCPMSLLPFEVDKRTIVEVEAVRTYNTANQWRATAVKRAKNHQDSNSSPEIKFSAISQLLCTASRCKTADMLIDQMQPRNVFAGASDLWTFVNSNPQLFSTRADLICMRSVEHIESFVQLVNALGPGSFSLSLLGDTLIDECKQFWMSAYGFDQRNRLFGFLYDHIELFEVLIEFPDPLHNEIKLSGTPYLPTLVQLEDMKAAQDIKISPAPSSLSLTEEVMMRTSDCETISDEDESEVEATAGYSCINDAPVGIVYQPISLPRPEINMRVSHRSQSEGQTSSVDESDSIPATKQVVYTFAAMSESEKRAVELVDSCLLAEESIEISTLYEKLKRHKLRPFTNCSTFKEFLAIRQHLYILDDHHHVSCLYPVRRCRVDLLLRLTQTQCNISNLYQQLGEENQILLQEKDNLLNVLRKYKNLFEITEEFEGERYVKARGRYNASKEVFLPYIYGDIRLRVENVQEKHQNKKFRESMYTKPELQRLMAKAIQFIKSKKSDLVESSEIFLSRCKPSAYYTKIEKEHNSVEQPYIKDRNGHQRSPINGRIKGLFLNVGKVDRSPFGDVCYRFKHNKLFNQRDFELFFADFYCPPKPPHAQNEPIHKVTVVVSKKQTKSWTYCQENLIKLNWERNDFFVLLEEGRCQVVTGKYGDVLLVEILFLEALNLKKGKRSIVGTIGTGQSRPLGLPANEQCPACSLR